MDASSVPNENYLERSSFDLIRERLAVLFAGLPVK